MNSLGGPVNYQQNQMMNQQMNQQMQYEHSKNASMSAPQHQVDISAGTSATKSQLITPQ